MASTPGGAGELELSAAARPEEIGSLRRALRDWLAGSGAGRDEVEDVSLAVGEALTNAVEHAYPDGQEGELAVRARRERDGVVAVAVRDYGHGDWRTPPPGSGRGCGLGLMQRLMDSVEVSWTPKGTEVVLRRRLGRGGSAPGRWSRGDAPGRARAPVR
ncbi:MAG: serine/threonine-protein kinase RsbW [Miltoncostaeaceae bacterium]|jgi:anti-sigma regulatory factor (Ser/Thr protein kinase)|nr:serine/threonine-protein kinase RsbW [Miltoncostaeaceae bacterium]